MGDKKNFKRENNKIRRDVKTNFKTNYQLVSLN